MPLRANCAPDGSRWKIENNTFQTWPSVHAINQQITPRCTTLAIVSCCWRSRLEQFFNYGQTMAKFIAHLHAISARPEAVYAVKHSDTTPPSTHNSLAFCLGNSSRMRSRLYGSDIICSPLFFTPTDQNEWLMSWTENWSISTSLTNFRKEEGTSRRCSCFNNGLDDSPPPSAIALPSQTLELQSLVSRWSPHGFVHWNPSRLIHDLWSSNLLPRGAKRSSRLTLNGEIINERITIQRPRGKFEFYETSSHKLIIHG